jgi:chromosome segregation ATPase
VNDVIEMDLKGVDLVVNPGVHGAKVLDIIESDNTSNVFISIEESINPNKDNNKGDPEMKYDLMEATLELLKSKRPDLFESVKEDLKPVFESEFKLGEITESVNTLTTTNGDLQESVNTLTEDKKILEADLDAVKNSLLESENKLKAIEESEKRAKLDTHISESISKLKFADSVKEKLKEKVSVLESTEEIDSVLESEVSYL